MYAADIKCLSGRVEEGVGREEIVQYNVDPCKDFLYDPVDITDKYMYN